LGLRIIFDQTFVIEQLISGRAGIWPCCAAAQP
jgi:hypothetical protein